MMNELVDQMLNDSGTHREVRVLDLLKMSNHTKIMRTSARDIRTASDFATIEPTSYGICHSLKS